MCRWLRIVVLLVLIVCFSISNGQCPTQLNHTINIDEKGSDDCTCFNNTEDSICNFKTLQNVLDCELKWNEDVCIYINSSTEEITGNVIVKVEGNVEMYITGIHTSETSISSQNSGEISFLTSNDSNDSIATIYLSNINFYDVHLRFAEVNVSVVNSSFEADEINMYLNFFVINAESLSFVHVMFDCARVKINDVSNVSIDMSTFTQTYIECNRSQGNELSIASTTHWIFKSSFFEGFNCKASPDNILLRLSGAVDNISFIDNTFQDNCNISLILLTTLNLVESFMFRENIVINNTNVSADHYAIDLKGSKQNCPGIIPTVSFIRNKFDNNTGLKCLIGTDTCCTTDNYYIENMFCNNKLASMTINTGNSSTHNISFSEFESNMARNTLVNFLTSKECRTQTEAFKIVAENLTFYLNTFSVPVEEDIQDPSVMTIQSVSADPHMKSVDLVECFLTDLDFTENYGTAMTLINVNIAGLSGELNFVKNTGAFGGGMLLDSINISQDAASSSAELYFCENTAKYGGALYIVDNPCFLSSDQCHINLTFENNRATVEGNGLYSQDPHCGCEFSIITNCSFEYYDSSDTPEVISRAYTMSVSAASLSLTDAAENETNNSTSNSAFFAFSGINVALNFSLADCNGTSVTCTAKVMALCDDDDNDQPSSPCAGHSNSGFKFELEGPVYVPLETGFRNINSNLSIGTNDSFNSKLRPMLFFQCRDNRGYEKIGATASIDVKPEQCPYGFSNTIVSENCICDGSLQETGQYKQYVCDFTSGTVCVKNGYWAGYIDFHQESRAIFVIKCNSINCNSNLFDRGNCSYMDGGLSTYIRIDIKSYNDSENPYDDRCVRNHSGLLCSRCLKGNDNSFDGYWCIDEDKCKDWHKPMLIALSTFWPILYGCFILFFIPRTQNGVGTFYCTFFFLAVLGQYIKTFDGEYHELTMVATFYVSTLLLGTRALGLLKWCFFDIGGMWVSFYDYLGPIIIFVLLLIVVLLFKKRPTIFLKFQSNPVMSMSIALVVTFWSLAFTSITLITPLRLPEEVDHSTRLDVEPGQPYFQNWHIPVFIVSLAFLVCIACVALVLLFSPVILGCLNKIKPFLDEFHHCYKTEYRWFSGVYFTSWIILSIFTILKQTVLFNSILYALLLLHCMCQPYKKVWLNRLDMFYLINLVVIVTLDVADESDPKWLYQTMKYITVILPLAYITVCGIYMVAKVLKTPLILFLKCARRITAVHYIPQNKAEQIRTSNNFEISESRIPTYTVDRKSTAVTSFTVSSGDEFGTVTKTNLEREPLLFTHRNEDSA